ncbi:MAG TPA: tetratricopeptide repeat protein [Bryobacteraceae bacterium]|nr:tetratricopeptide repeat protein [Bryobacteraceae bacterium]
MLSVRLFLAVTIIASALALAVPAAAETYSVIMQGNVVMLDGSPPPKTAGIERVCSDTQGSAPGPITDKKGHYLWRQDLDPMLTRVCYLQATLPGFLSTHIDISSLSLSTFTGSSNEKTMPDLVLSPRDSGDAHNVVLIRESEAPGKAKPLYKAALKALDDNNTDEGIKQLQQAVEAVPKFADGWNILGALYERQMKYKEALDALQHAVEANPKLLSPHLRIARISNRLGDWDAAAKAEDTLIKADKRFYPEIYLQQAITRAETKDYPGAEESAKTALNLDAKHQQVSRAEYVLGRIALAKGDLDAAKQHISAYISMDPTAPDLEQIQVQLNTLGNKDAGVLKIPLERP